MGDEGTSIVDYCRAREALRRAQVSTRDARAEQVDAERTLGGLLTESMRRHDVECLALPHGGYARLVQPARRAPPLKTEDEALALVDDVARHVTEVPAEGLPAAVVKLVQRRARERGGGDGAAPPPPPPPRVRVVQKMPQRRGSADGAPPRVTEPAMAPTETRVLTEQFSEACRERRAAREELQPLRAEQRRTEEALLPALTAPATVRMETPTGAARVLHVVRCAAPPSRRTTGYGIRRVSALVRRAAADASKERHTFDEVLRARFAHLLRTEEAEAREATDAAPPAPKMRLKVVRLPAGAEALAARAVERKEEEEAGAPPAQPGSL